MINEILCYALVNARASARGRLAYDHAVYVGYGHSNDRYGRILAKGNELEIGDGILFVWNSGRLIEGLETSCARGIMDVPIVLEFD
jgi:hypothetical protein